MSPPWRATVLTLFPEMFPGPLGASLAGKALAEGRWALDAIDIRDFATDKHRSVDDTPAGGGAGMVMRADIAAAAIDAARAKLPEAPTIYLSPRGVPLTQARVRTLAQGPGAILLCGRFEGIDQRVLEARNVEEISIGDYVLSGGELAAQVLIDACVRLLPAWPATKARLPRRASPRACSNIRITRGRASGKAAPSPRCCSPATMRKSPNGAASRRRSSPRSAARICGALPQG